MKKIYLILVLSFASCLGKLHAQAFSIFGGYNNSSGAYKSVNQFIDNYNSTRQGSLTTPMPHIKALTGANFGFGLYMGFMLEAEWIGRSAEVSGVVKDQGNPDIHHDFKIRDNAGSITVGGCGGNDKFAIGGGISMELATIKTFDRAYYEGSKAPEYGDNIGFSDVNLGFSPTALLYVKLAGPLVVGIRPYYTMYLFKQDLNEEEVQINYRQDPIYYQDNPDLVKPLNHFGIQIRLGIMNLDGLN